MNNSEFASPLYFIRHGETDWNRQRRFQGQSDVPLNQCGKEQAHKNGALLAEYLSKCRLQNTQLFFISSPLVRARETTEIILEEAGLQKDLYSTSNALKEISFGLWEGLTSAEAKQQYYHERQRRRTNRWSIAPPEGQSFAQRVNEVHQLLVRLPAHCVIISHSGIMRIILHILEILPSNEAVNADIPHIGIHIWDGTSLVQT